ncbi:MULTISPECIES: NAD(P)-dependent alcohol dehydrogenase [Gordonia]|uniref:NAD(P)-dependent alcohol dehydrogenase n=1 Tax=Gordonia TaxID=2053 RepID=UPI0002A62657|nr:MULTISPECIES: NAD(P)-dependent alcohol dehydrogenase [Gordonia]ATD72599.1 NAD(P)-dependent alcohol dehydrogenase [Gordonia sp. 1D]MBA5848153.1 NAD(P)-dependent alcohol dehydrogenase [Gordonia amicalis]MCZ0915193.1 NAD(P)-dependent alcohol dehydrogenase [Gordonia amicalis]MDV7172531.1 NAD(P)-dependent alcohol dehydrogenase [Gordonia amicalis]NKX76118.1 NAD(P)-dependent alcohol dehydrogenase [Gordonia amicalis]
MPTTVNAYIAPAADRPLEPTTIERRDLGPNDVAIAIAYAGICHSDIHTARDEWGGTRFPVVPGHEIAGTVSAVGEGVTRYAVGDRVGVGCFVDSCRECEPCRLGEEQYCERGSTGTYNALGRDGQPTHGGYSTSIVVDENYVCRIPEGIALDEAAPLLCAGITLYSPLRHWGAGPGKKVAIVGLGGLGHVGVKIAHALGAEVTVLSQSLKKMEDGLRLGADHYHATSDPQTFRDLRNSFDLILNTVSANLPIGKYLGMLALDGTLVELGLPEHPIDVPAGALIGKRRSFSGSMIGGIAQTQEMLDFCAEHGIGAEIEVISADRINEAYDRVVASDVRYRFVIDAATL